VPSNFLCTLIFLQTFTVFPFFCSSWQTSLISPPANAALVSGANRRKRIIDPIAISFFMGSPQISGSGAGGGAFLPPNPVVIAAGAADTVGIFMFALNPPAEGVSFTGAGAGGGV